MTRYYCDRCRKEVERGTMLQELCNIVELRAPERPLPQMDICPSCQYAIVTSVESVCCPLPKVRND